MMTDDDGDDDDDANDDNVLNGPASYTFRRNVTRRMARLQLCRCFSAKKLTSYSDQSALRVSHVTYIGL